MIIDNSQSEFIIFGIWEWKVELLSKQVEKRGRKPGSGRPRKNQPAKSKTTFKVPKVRFLSSISYVVGYSEVLSR